MANDMLGPLGPRATLVRPAVDVDTYGAATWFKNCSAAGAQDGTVPTASFMNVLIGNLRYCIQQTGWTQPAAPAVWDQSTADRVLYECIQRAIDARITQTGAGLLAIGTGL